MTETIYEPRLKIRVLVESEDEVNGKITEQESTEICSRTPGRIAIFPRPCAV